jgi:hypothetical protein
MSFFGTRRSRQARVFRPTPSVRDRLLSALRDYRVLTLILIAFLAIGLLLIAMQAWNASFAYRAGQFAAYGIQARTDFEEENLFETASVRMLAEKSAPLVLVQEADVIDRLESQLRAQLSEIVNAQSVSELSGTTRLAFNLTAGDDASIQAAFNSLQNLLKDPDDSSGRRIDQLLSEFGRLMSDARALGLMDPVTARRLSGETPEAAAIDRSRAIKVVDVRGADVHNGVLADVLLTEQLQETGRLGKVWAGLSNLAPLRGAVEAWLVQNFRSQLRLDPDATTLARKTASESAPRQFKQYPKGSVVIPAGTELTEASDSIGLLKLEHEAHQQDLTFGQRLTRMLGLSMLILLLVILLGLFLKVTDPRILSDTPRLLVFVVMCAATVLLSCLMSRDPWRAEIAPLLAAVMITAIAWNPIIALLTAFSLSLLISMATLADLGHFLTLMTISVTSIVPLRRIKSRLVMIKAGFLLFAVAFYTVWGVGVIQAHDSDHAWRNMALITTALKFAAYSFLCCCLVAELLPFIEKAFGIVTDISLLELTAVSHPLLQELARRAPGTYNHSMTVASLAEAAAESIGANGLLCRVGAYFHDIGKMLKPEYFIENMTEGSVNPHQSLAPAMSTLIIIGHVKDGLELAEEHHLPEPLRAFIEQHHGTTLVEYFFHEASRKLDEDHRTDADESSFRYPGAKPQTRETAVLMLADAIESASRTLKEPAPKRIQSLVHEIAMKRLLDGQFDECDLKMDEIRTIEESLVKSLLAAHHGRVRYPGQRTA